MLNIDDLALVVDAATRYMQGIDPDEMTEEDKRVIVAIRTVTEHGEVAEEDLPVDKITKRRGDWCQTRSGRRFFAFDPMPADIDMDDMAWGLNLTTRFGGQSDFYPVTVHSFRVAEIANCLARRKELDEEDRFLVRIYAIVHDGHEGYTPDVQRPIKRSLPRVKEMEALVQNAIHQRLRLPPIPPHLNEIVKMADELALLIEAEELFPKTYHLWPVAQMPHAELDDEVRRAATIPLEWQRILADVNKRLLPIYEAMKTAFIEIDHELARRFEEAVPPEEAAVVPGRSSWRAETPVVNISEEDMYGAPEIIKVKMRQRRPGG